jgi:flagellar biogenesis protein FliO
MCIPGMALAETGAGETLPSTADLFSWSYLGQVIASLALVIGLLFGALWIMRRVKCGSSPALV